MKDVFGQTLGQAAKVTIHTGNFAPGAWAPTGTSVIPAGTAVALNFYATNLPGNRYQAAYARYPARRDARHRRPADGAAAAEELAEPHARRARARNAQSVVRVPLQSELGGPFGALAYGFRTALDAPDTSPGLTGIAQVTNLGVFAQWFRIARQRARAASQRWRAGCGVGA